MELPPRVPDPLTSWLYYRHAQSITWNTDIRTLEMHVPLALSSSHSDFHRSLILEHWNDASRFPWIVTTDTRNHHFGAVVLKNKSVLEVFITRPPKHITDWIIKICRFHTYWQPRVSSIPDFQPTKMKEVLIRNPTVEGWKGTCVFDVHMCA